MSELSLISKLVAWYSEQCNGEWEHGSGIEIGTLDNPGWLVKINLRETRLADANFEAIKIDTSENDWLSCRKKDGDFVGAGDPFKLATILEHFLKFAGKL